jgi:hypothetical protein
MEDSKRPILLDPWVSGPELHGAAERFTREAAIEIGPDHDLSGRALTVIAACSACDEVAFQIDDGTFALVHLTWIRRQEPAPWPFAQIYRDYHALEAAADEHADEHHH